MSSRLQTSFIGGLLGALITMGLMAIRKALTGTEPIFITAYKNLIAPNATITAALIGGGLFALSGGLWGLLYGLTITRDRPIKGLLFGTAPAFWLLLVVAPLMLNQPIFFGFAAPEVLPPILFNCLVWGLFVGWYVHHNTA